MQIQIVMLVLFFSFFTAAQTSVTVKNKNPFPVKYVSTIDQKIILKTLTLAPVYDNINGIYSEPVQKLLIDLLKNDKTWGYSEFPGLNKKLFIEEFDTHPSDVLEVLSKTGSQGLLTAFITKGPQGLTATLKLFTQDEGLILIEESFHDIYIFEVQKLKEIFTTMYDKIKNKLPYRGYVLSRRGLEVTINLGSENGIEAGQELTLAQIIKLNRHPKLKVMIGAEKEIIAKVKVTQVEPYLSFAQISFEKETGVVDVGAKILPVGHVTYSIPHARSDGVAKFSDNSDNNTEIFFRILTVQGVLTQYKESTDLRSGVSTSVADNSTQGFYLGLQIYQTKNIFVAFDTQLKTFEGANTLAGSTPARLGYTFNSYSGSIGYDYLMEYSEADEEDDGLRPTKLTAALGFTSIRTDISRSTPVALTSTQTDSLNLKLKAEMSLTPENPLIVGGQLDLFLTPQFSESPVSSGESKATVTSLGFFGLYPISNRLRIRGDVNVFNIATSFSGAGTRTDPSSSTLIQTLNEQIGLEYSF